MKFTKKEKAIIYHGYNATVHAMDAVRNGKKVTDNDAVLISNMLNTFGTAANYETVESYVITVAIGITRLAKVKEGWYQVKVNGIASFTKWNVEKAMDCRFTDIISNAGKEPTLTTKKATKTFKNPFYDKLAAAGIDADTVNETIKNALEMLLSKAA